MTSRRFPPQAHEWGVLDGPGAEAPRLTRRVARCNAPSSPLGAMHPAARSRSVQCTQLTGHHSWTQRLPSQRMIFWRQPSSKPWPAAHIRLPR